MMYKFKCKKCGIECKIDTGDKTVEQAKQWLKKLDSFECPGHHVEITSPLKFWDIDWDNPIDEKAPAEEEWLANLKETYDNAVWAHDEVERDFTVIGFSAGMMVVRHNRSGIEDMLTWSTSPQGHRYYHR